MAFHLPPAALNPYDPTRSEHAIWRLETPGEGPVVAAAIHAGHDVRAEVRDLLALSNEERLREEDPFTAEWTTIGDTRIVGLRSRFEVDLNRDPNRAVYLKPEDAWGLDVWRNGPPPHVIDRSLEAYDAFYASMHRLLQEVERRHGRFVVYDLHAYNHRRGGPDHPPEDPELNPDINVGTGSMNLERWGPVVDPFLNALREADFLGRRLDVRENVKFTGGHFSEWIHSRFPESGCALAIEVKKFFMDEWTGTPFWEMIHAVRDILAHTLKPATEGLRDVS
jgi:N-formylglutamate amidohydrolase